MPSHLPLPGVLDIGPSDRVRVTVLEPAEMDPGDGERAAATVLTWAKGRPQLIDGAWMVPVVGIGLVSAGQVRKAE